MYNKPESQYRCSRCGLKIRENIGYCPACGFEISHAKKTTEKQNKNHDNPPIPPPYDHNGYDRNPMVTEPLNSSRKNQKPSNSQRKTGSTLEFEKPFAWKTLSGVVIAVEAPYMAKPEINSFVAILKLTMGIILLPALGFLILLVFAWKVAWVLMFPSIFPTRNNESGGGASFLSNLASQIISFFLMGKLFGKKELVPVRDIRLRSSEGSEHLVRIKGDLITGNINVGDNIKVSGINRKGTLFFRRGINNRTNSEITVRLT